MAAVNIQADLRPDYHEWFPFFSDKEMRVRLDRLPFARATLLSVPGIRQAIRIDHRCRQRLAEFISLPYDSQRRELAAVLRQVGISSQVAEAIGRVPREKFCPPGTERYCYLNTFLPWNDGSCVSGPGIVALMLDDLLPIQGKVAEVGIGSGYHAACLLEACSGAVSVLGFETNSLYAEFGRECLVRAGYPGVEIIEANARAADIPGCHVNAIYCTAAGSWDMNDPILQRLGDGGVFQVVRPLTRSEFEGEPEISWLKRTYGDYDGYRAGGWRRYACLSTSVRIDGCLTERSRLYDVSFVPLQDKPANAAPSHVRGWSDELDSLLPSNYT